MYTRVIGGLPNVILKVQRFSFNSKVLNALKEMQFLFAYAKIELELTFDPPICFLIQYFYRLIEMEICSMACIHFIFIL